MFVHKKSYVRLIKLIECGVVVGCRLIGGSTRWLFVMLNMCMWKLNEHSMKGTKHS